MKKLIFLSQSKLATNLVRFLLNETKIDVKAHTQISEWPLKTVSNKNTLFVVDESFFEKNPGVDWQSFFPDSKSLKIIFLASSSPHPQLSFKTLEVIQKPFLADDFAKKVSLALGVKS